MPITAEDLAVDFFPRVGFATASSRIDAWRQIHLAAQALVHLGKSWGNKREDDAHAALIWSEDDAGWLAEGSGPSGHVIGWLDFGGASLWLERRDPQEGAWIEIESRSIDELSGWVRQAAERLAGTGPKQPATPAPDLPDHPTARGEPFSLHETDARADLESLYEGAGLLLTVLRDALGSSHGAETDDAAPRIWPHHFDAASVFVVRRDEKGAATSTIGVGLAPPDDIEPAGYWYVSPWSKAGVSAIPLPTPVTNAKWHTRGETLPIAVLPLTEITHLEEGEAQHARIAAFCEGAFNACEHMLKD